MEERTNAARECWYIPHTAAHIGVPRRDDHYMCLLWASISATKGLDGGMPSATDLVAVNTFDPHGGLWPQECNPAPSTLAALLPNQQKTPSAGLPTHIGEGLPPVPARLAAKILRHEFVEMHELLPEFWHNHKGGKAGDRAKSKKRALDLKVWLQCYTAYVGVLGPKYAQEVPELLAYMTTIIRASQKYEGSAWVAYDTAYRRQAAAQGKTEWSRINPSLYVICFTGKARRADRCDRCLGTTHKAELWARPGWWTGATAASAPPIRRRTAVSSPRRTPMSVNASKRLSRRSSLSRELPPLGRPNRADDQPKPAVTGTRISAPSWVAGTHTTARLAGAVIQQWNARWSRRTHIQLVRPAALHNPHGLTPTLHTRTTRPNGVRNWPQCCSPP